MITVFDKEEIKKMLGCKKEVLISSVNLKDGDTARSCYKLAVDPDGDLFYNNNGIWSGITSGGGGGIESIQEGSNITVDNTDPLNPIISSSGGSGSPDTPTTLIDGATITWDTAISTNAGVTISGNRTLVITNSIPGDYGTLVITQGGGGNYNLILPTGSKVINNNNSVLPLSTISGYIDIATYYYDGVTYFWNLGKVYN